MTGYGEEHRYTYCNLTLVLCFDLDITRTLNSNSVEYHGNPLCMTWYNLGRLGMTWYRRNPPHVAHQLLSFLKCKPWSSVPSIRELVVATNKFRIPRDTYCSVVPLQPPQMTNHHNYRANSIASTGISCLVLRFSNLPLLFYRIYLTWLLTSVGSAAQ